MASLDANVIKVAVPAIGRDLGASVASLQWTVTSYLVMVAALLLLAGGLADRFGRRRILMIGLFVMLGILGPLRRRPNGGRLDRGAGRPRYRRRFGHPDQPGPAERKPPSFRSRPRHRDLGRHRDARDHGRPYIGGWLVDYASWRAVFLLSVSLVLAGLVMLRWVPTTRSARRRLSLDVTCGLLAVVGLGAVVYALTAGSQDGWYSAPIVIVAAVGVAALAVLTPVERRVRAPMLRL